MFSSSAVQPILFWRQVIVFINFFAFTSGLRIIAQELVNNWSNSERGDAEKKDNTLIYIILSVEFVCTRSTTGESLNCETRKCFFHFMCYVIGCLGSPDYLLHFHVYWKTEEWLENVRATLDSRFELYFFLPLYL